MVNLSDLTKKKEIIQYDVIKVRVNAEHLSAVVNNSLDTELLVQKAFEEVYLQIERKGLLSKGPKKEVITHERRGSIDGNTPKDDRGQSLIHIGKILKAIKENPGIIANDVANMVQLDVSTISQHLRWLDMEGYIKRERVGEDRGLHCTILKDYSPGITDEITINKVDYLG